MCIMDMCIRKKDKKKNKIVRQIRKEKDRKNKIVYEETEKWQKYWTLDQLKRRCNMGQQISLHTT